MIADEVARHMQPINQAVAEVKRQNDVQSELMGKLIEWRHASEKWCVKLWSNGSGGPPGYLEMAREEDNRRYRKLFEEISELKAESLREEGAEELRQKMEAAAEARVTHRWNRAQSWIKISIALGASLGSYVFHPALHAFAVWLGRVFQ